MKPNIANIAELGISEENRELYRKAFEGGYLPMWQFDLILKSEFDGWVEVERQAEEIERLRKALEYYKDEENYSSFDADSGEIRLDANAGKVAREALSDAMR